MKFIKGLSLLSLFLSCLTHADVGIVLHETIGSIGRMEGTGHAAVYLSRICPETPVKLRLCREGESGSILTRAASFGSETHFDWMLIPAAPFFYGAESPSSSPLMATKSIRNFVREKYREEYFKDFIPDSKGEKIPQGYWSQTIGVTMDRGIYIFNFETSREEDLQFIDEFNRFSNTNKFNIMFNNCADFAKKVFNIYFPHAAHRDVFRDLGMTTPKAVARSVVKFAEHNPQIKFNVMRMAQIPGTLPRSSGVNNIIESGFRLKRYLIPLAIFQPYVLAGLIGDYYLGGHFDPYKTYTQHVAQSEQERRAIIGNKEEWSALREKILESNPDSKKPQVFFKYLDSHGEPTWDAQGEIAMKVHLDDGSEKLVGLDSNNILKYDRDLGEQALVARLISDVKAKPKNRPSIETVRQELSLQ